MTGDLTRYAHILYIVRTLRVACITIGQSGIHERLCSYFQRSQVAANHMTNIKSMPPNHLAYNPVPQNGPVVFGLSTSNTSKFAMRFCWTSVFLLFVAIRFFSFRLLFSLHVTIHSIMAPPKNAKNTLKATVPTVKLAATV
jgi:hypothetical protein